MPDVAHLRRRVDAVQLVRLPRTEVGVFRAALAVVMIAVADDAFIDRAPGVAATDHLASGLVPLACGALMIALAPRLPALLRGWLAIFAGALAIVGGATDGVVHPTAVLAGAAGAVLLASGVATLWRTRSTTGRWFLRRAGIGAAVLVLGVLVALPIGIATAAARARAAATTTPSAGRASPTCARRSAYLRRQPDVDRSRIGGLGLSVGGELLLQTAAHTRALRAVVSEGAGQRSLAEHLDNPRIGRVQRWFSGMVTQTAAVAVLSNSRPPSSLAGLVPRIAPRPVLLIKAVNGHPDEVLNDVYARGPTAELWRVTAGGHTGALAAAPAEYEQRVAAFFDRALR